MAATGWAASGATTTSAQTSTSVCACTPKSRPSLRWASTRPQGANCTRLTTPASVARRSSSRVGLGRSSTLRSTTRRTRGKRSSTSTTRPKTWSKSQPTTSTTDCHDPQQSDSTSTHIRGGAAAGQVQRGATQLPRPPEVHHLPLHLPQLTLPLDQLLQLALHDRVVLPAVPQVARQLRHPLLQVDDLLVFLAEFVLVEGLEHAAFALGLGSEAVLVGVLGLL